MFNIIYLQCWQDMNRVLIKLVYYKSDMGEQEQTWPFIASIIYTTAWSVSFYGQVYENWKYKSVEGYSMNYLVMNICGDLLYGIYSTLGYFFHFRGAGTVVVADLVFIYHALLMCVILTIQACIYPYGKNRVSIYTIILCITVWSLILLQIVFTQLFHFLPVDEYINPVSSMGYGKLLLSFIKYSPAVYWNWKRKSTKGWSIFNILLDLVGAAFSMTSGGLSVSNGLNITKLVLAFLTIFYDLIFVFQHYCLYNKKSVDEKKEELTEEKKSLIQ